MDLLIQHEELSHTCLSTELPEGKRFHSPASRAAMAGHDRWSHGFHGGKACKMSRKTHPLIKPTALVAIRIAEDMIFI